MNLAISVQSPLFICGLVGVMVLFLAAMAFFKEPAVDSGTDWHNNHFFGPAAGFACAQCDCRLNSHPVGSYFSPL